MVHYIASPHVIESTVGDEVILLHLEKGVYFGLDAVGAFIWPLVKQGLTPEQIAAQVTAEYDAEVETVRADVEALLAELMSHDIVSPAG